MAWRQLQCPSQRFTAHLPTFYVLGRREAGDFPCSGSMWRGFESGLVEQRRCIILFARAAWKGGLDNKISFNWPNVRTNRSIGRLCSIPSLRNDDAPRERLGSSYNPWSLPQNVARTIICASPLRETYMRLLCHSSVRRAVSLPRGVARVIVTMVVKKKIKNKDQRQ